MEKTIQVGETKGFLYQIGKFCYQFTNKKTGKVTKFGLNTISGSKVMQKKKGSWYKVAVTVLFVTLVGLFITGINP